MYHTPPHFTGLYCHHLRFGLPAGIEPFLNWFAFNVFVQIMHSYGPDTAAAATIAFNWDSIAFAGSLALVFSSGFQDTDGKIATMAATMLRLLATYRIANSSKLVLGGSLRAAGDTAWAMWVSIVIHWAMAVVAVILVRVIHAHQYVTWSTLIIMNNAHATTILYRFRTGKWKKMALIG